MDIQASKQELVKMIMETEDASKIEKMKDVFLEEDLTDEQKLAIDEALEEFEQGQGIPHDIVMKEMKERYPQYFGK
jgi:DNA polymerase IIIc chi subunit